MTWPSGIWLALLPLGSFVLGWVHGILVAAVALRRLRRCSSAPWVERARRVFPARRLLAASGPTLSIFLGAFVAVNVATGPGRMPWAVLCALCSLLGSMLVVNWLERRLCEQGAKVGGGVSLDFILLVLRIVPVALVVAFMPWWRWGWPAAGVLALAGAIVTLRVRGGWLVLLGWLGLVRPASPRLEAIVERASVRAAIQPRATVELDVLHTNALALPVPRMLAFTTPILAFLDDDELAAVAAHELAHLAEPRAVLAVRIVAAYLPLVLLASIPLVATFGLAGFVPAALGVTGRFLHKRVERRMELRSDRAGREHEGESAGTYARALNKIYEANLMPAVISKRGQTHPNLYDRLVAAGVEPAYARPAPPPSDIPAALIVALPPAVLWFMALLPLLESAGWVPPWDVTPTQGALP